MTNPSIRTQTKTPRTEFPIASFFLYGKPKIGKTTAAAQFPAPLVINVFSENGTTELAADVADIRTADDLLTLARWLKSNQHPYQTIVLDGISTLAIDASASKNTKDTRRAVKEANKNLLPALHEFLSLPLIRVITGHARFEEEEIELINGKPAKKISVYPDLPPRLRLFVEGRVTAFAYCYNDKGESKAWWLPLESETRVISAGNRLGLPKCTALTYQAIHDALIAPPITTQENKP